MITTTIYQQNPTSLPKLMINPKTNEIFIIINIYGDNAFGYQISDGNHLNLKYVPLLLCDIHEFNGSITLSNND